MMSKNHVDISLGMANHNQSTTMASANNTQHNGAGIRERRTHSIAGYAT